MDLVRLVFDRLYAAGSPDAEARAAIYADCRARVAAMHADAMARAKALDRLETVIRRQEMQALYEEGLQRKLEP
jgi:acetyl-CoA carboxylase carboxyltransferase component